MAATKNQIQFVKSLSNKSERDSTGLFVVEGPKVVNEVLKCDWAVHSIYAVPDWEPQREEVVRVTEKDLGRMSQLKTANQVIAVVQQKHSSEAELKESDVILVFDGINDPGNLGTIIRTADWFGINAIVCSHQSVDHFNSKVVQSAMGSLFRTKVVRTNLPELLRGMNRTIYGACMEGQPISSIEITKPCILVFGSESHGISDEVLAHVNRKITIEGKGTAESLNVATAAGIFMQKLTD